MLQVLLNGDEFATVAALSTSKDTSPYDLPVTEFATVTRDALVRLADAMLRKGYSLSYIKAALVRVRSDCRYAECFPLTTFEYNAFVRTVAATKTELYMSRTKQSEYVYAMSDEEYDVMRTYAASYLADTATTSKARRVLFCYLFLMMYYTGKRMSDIVCLSIDDVRCLLENGDVAVRVPKVDRIGRVTLASIPEREQCEAFLRDAIRIPVPGVPCSAERIRRRMNRTFKLVYESLFRRAKPNGLSFYSLRRRRAAASFRQGWPLDRIRESLDHSSTATTNVYINRFLLTDTERREAQRRSRLNSS